jgi:transposase
MTVPNFLNLSTITILSVGETEHDYHVTAESALPPLSCTTCRSKDIVGFGKRAQLYNDLPIHGKRVGITINRKRYKCKTCGVTFYEPLVSIHENHRATTRLVRYVEHESMRRTFASVAEDAGIDEKTIRSVFKRHADHLDATVRFELPQWMGIDEIHIIKKPRCVITNVEHNTIVNMIPNREMTALTAYLKDLPNKGRIRYVAMEMWRPYKSAVKAHMPDAKIVVDKFHVVRMGNVALEMHRKAIRRTLNSRQRAKLMRDRFILLQRPADITPEERDLMGPWFEAFPTLGLAYELKEEFYGVWENAASRADAESSYKTWLAKIVPDVEPHFKPIVTAFENWHEEIFSYFDHPITNAYTESLNSLIRVINRNGRGYSFEALRAKVLYTEGTHRIDKPAHRAVTRKPPPGISSFETGRIVETDIPKAKNYGAFIPDVVEMLERETRK